ncbi:ParA family protein [Ruminococcaceae bacterium OttesenSCG-928-A11]|nr:ParA family protein [Ruminococcaceae bacterium OttesenSCG-928-A11]
MEVIALVNQKGGVLKTTTTANLGVGLASLGKKVLLIDADPQGSLTTALGFKQPDELPFSLANVMDGYIRGRPVPTDAGILHHEEGVDLMPANDQLDDTDITLVAVPRREYLLKKYVDAQRPNYDYILIDCRPSLSMMTMNAMAAADSLIIPVQTQYSPLKGLERLVRSYGQVVDEGINPNLSIKGIVLTLHDNTSLAQKSVNNVRNFYGQVIHVFDAIIPKSTRSAESAAHGVSVYKHDPGGKAAKAYMQLTKEVTGNGKSRRHDRATEAR